MKTRLQADPGWARLRCLLAVGVAVPWLNVCGIAAQDGSQIELREQLIAESVKWFDGLGTVLLTYDSTTKSGRGGGRRSVGFDFTTGAYFIADHAMGASGRTATGEYYQGIGSDRIGGDFGGTVQVEPTTNPTEAMQRVTRGPHQSIPAVMLFNLRTTTEGLYAIERDQAGNWIIAIEGGTPDPNVKRIMRTWFGPDGTPLRYHAEADPSTQRPEVAFDFEIEPDSPPGLAIVKQFRPNDTKVELVDIQYYPQSRPDLFAVDFARDLAIDNHARLRVRLDEAANREVGSTVPPVGPYAKTRIGGASLPLIITGIIVVGIGVFVIVRSRMST